MLQSLTVQSTRGHPVWMGRKYCIVTGGCSQVQYQSQSQTWDSNTDMNPSAQYDAMILVQEIS